MDKTDSLVTLILIFSFIGLIVLGVILGVILWLIDRKKIKRMMQDERLKNAKLYYNSVAISPEGFIGFLDFKKINIIHIKEIKSFQILFDKEKLDNDSGEIIFNNIVSKVEPYLNKETENINLIIKIDNKDDELKISLLSRNSTNLSTQRTKRKIIHKVSGPFQSLIKEFLSELEKVEKNVKGDY